MLTRHEPIEWDGAVELKDPGQSHPVGRRYKTCRGFPGLGFHFMEAPGLSEKGSQSVLSAVGRGAGPRGADAPFRHGGLMSNSSPVRRPSALTK